MRGGRRPGAGRKTDSGRAEDLAWMADTGESATGAAKRLGITRKALEKWCSRNAPHLWGQLLAHEPRDLNWRTGGPNQWTA